MPEFCFVCKKTFLTRPNLNRHLKEVHGSGKENTREETINCLNYTQETHLFKCLEGCSVSFKCNKDLRNHLEIEHKFQITNEALIFGELNEFEDWLQQTEIANNIKFSKHRGVKRNLDETEIVYFNCSRSGKQKIVGDGIRKRSLKIQGSAKLGQGCTSQIILTKTVNGQYKVEYFKEHYGHEHELKHLNLSKDCRKTIASKLRMGITPQHILSTTREKIGGTSLKRDDLVTIKDISNIKTSFNISIKDGQRHKDDVTSVELYIEECKMLDADNPILFYKKQGQICNKYSFQERDMCLIIMYPIQKELFKQFAGDIVCVDGTHGLNNYDFEMTSILVLDEFREGFPVAFMFSNRKDQYVYEIFFRIIKDTVNMDVINTKTFMTDMATVYYNAWLSVMGCYSTSHFFCSWHVDKAWQQNLVKVSDAEKRSWVYKSLKYLQTTLVEKDFEEGFSEFLTLLHADESTQEICKYLKNNYFNNRTQWAYCYRKGRGINTNMFLESMHKVIKYSYLDGKKVKRLDRTLYSIQRYIRDLSANRIIKLIKGKHSKQVQDIRKRHRVALSSNFNTSVQNNIFICSSGDDRDSYQVNRKNNITLCCCELKCSYCNVCWHAFECTCLDYQIKNMICKHIHYIILKYSHQLRVTDTINNVNYNDVSTVLKNINKESQLTSTSQILDKDESVINIKKELVKNAALQLISNLDTKSFLLEDYDFMLKNLKVLNNIGIVDIQQSKLKNTAFESKCDFPPNKKIEKQKFFSTKKKMATTSNKMSTPNIEDKVIIKEVLSQSLYVSKDSEHDHKYALS